MAPYNRRISGCRWPKKLGIPGVLCYGFGHGGCKPCRDPEPSRAACRRPRSRRRSGPHQGDQRRSGSSQCPSRAAEREDAPGPLWTTLGTLPPADRPDGAGFRGVRGRSQRGRGLCSPGCRLNQRRTVRTQAARTQAIARSSASRTRRHLRARGLPVLWFRSSGQAG